MKLIADKKVNTRETGDGSASPASGIARCSLALQA